MQIFRRLVFGLLFLISACAPVHIPTSDATPTFPATPTIVVKPSNVPATDAPVPTPTMPLPEGGAITLGTIGNTNLELNGMPAIVQNAVFESLLQIDPFNGALKPGLAESYQVSNDATSITFSLRPGIKWHTGDALTAADVVASINAFSSS